MATPETHALLSASSASRWLKCTAAPRFEENFPETTSDYAEEGRLAHEICELKARKHFSHNDAERKDIDLLIACRTADPRYLPEMATTSDVYVEYLASTAMSYDSPPYVALERQVSFAGYVPEGFGTCDCVMIGGDTLHIVDYKHGKGIPVSAENNAQMRLYALGALDNYHAIYGDNITQVCMTIIQPRIADTPSSVIISSAELREWGEIIKPIARAAYDGNGVFVPGEHCRFCRGKARCRARAEVNTALEDFKNVQLSDAEIGDLLTRGKELVAWYHDMEDYALNAIMQGQDVPGWKVVAGRSNRAFTDQDAAITAITRAGYDMAMLYDSKPKSLSELEKLMGKAAFTKTVGEYVTKPTGKPTLVTETDPREQYSPAVTDFAGL